MKVGDLVVLSAYGAVREYNSRLTMDDPKQTGIVIKIRRNASYPYEVFWSKSPDTNIGHTRRELRYAYRGKNR